MGINPVRGITESAGVYIKLDSDLAILSDIVKAVFVFDHPLARLITSID